MHFVQLLIDRIEITKLGGANTPYLRDSYEVSSLVANHLCVLFTKSLEKRTDRLGK